LAVAVVMAQVLEELGTSGQGNAGGTGAAQSGAHGTGGGGGASAAGANRNNDYWWCGWCWYASSITGTSIYYAGGGGGGNQTDSYSVASGGLVVEVMVMAVVQVDKMEQPILVVVQVAHPTTLARQNQVVQAS